MPFDWKQYLEVARHLKRQAESLPHEAALRSAVSRAYYSAFGFARNYAHRWLGFMPKSDADDHGALRARLKPKRRATSDRLDRLRQWRNDCDYRDDLGFDLTLVLETALQEAAAVFAELSPPKLPAPPS